MQTLPLVAICAMALAGMAPAQVDVGDAAPAFPIKDSLGSTAKDVKDITSLRGKVLMLDFFATW